MTGARGSIGDPGAAGPEIPPHAYLSRLEVYRQANRAERVAREAADAATLDVLDAIGWAFLTAGAVLIFSAGFRKAGVR